LSMRWPNGLLHIDSDMLNFQGFSTDRAWRTSVSICPFDSATYSERRGH
jgi:hypothetical protein